MTYSHSPFPNGPFRDGPFRDGDLRSKLRSSAARMRDGPFRDGAVRSKSCEAELRACIRIIIVIVVTPNSN